MCRMCAPVIFPVPRSNTKEDISSARTTSLMRRIIAGLLGLVLLVVLAGGFVVYQKALRPNVPEHLDHAILLIADGATLEDIVDSLLVNGQIKDEKSFRWTSAKMGFSDVAIRRGRYTVPARASNRTLISILRGGRQTPVSLTLQNVRTIDQLCGRVAGKLEFDSASLAMYLDTRFDSLAGTRRETRLTRFLPNTYEVYWTVTPEDFCRRMLKEYDRFWNDARNAKLAATGLTREEVYTLASIIEKETTYNPEKPRMAGVYLNRLRTGMPLQADPTIVFALGDFALRRILFEHLRIDSPFNTYKNIGLPPGPIFMPGTASIDAVLNHENHSYLFFCAKPTSDGEGHAYAIDLPAHNENARRYQRWLDNNGIK